MTQSIFLLAGLLLYFLQPPGVSAFFIPEPVHSVHTVHTLRRTIHPNNGQLRSRPMRTHASTKPAHDNLTYRVRPGVAGGLSSFPQPERYSSKDWLHNLMTLPNSSVLKRIRGVILVNTIWATMVLVFYRITKFLTPGSRCYSLLGSALGLLLVFRTNSAYNRFWEGRKIYGVVLTVLRDLLRFCAVYWQVIGISMLTEIFSLIKAFPGVLAQHLVGPSSRVQSVNESPDTFQGILAVDILVEMDRIKNKPLYITNKLACNVRRIPDSGAIFGSRERGAMLTYVDKLCQAIGDAERIVQTPIPLPYARHTSRYLTLFCLAAPIALVKELSGYVIPFTSFLTWSLFGILEIGLSIEEPFSKALQLDVFSDAIFNDAADTMATIVLADAAYPH